MRKSIRERSFRFLLLLATWIALALTPAVQGQQQSQQQHQQQQSKPEKAKKPVRTFVRPDDSCPPTGLSELYQWDDGKGNDMTVEVLCVEDAKGFHYYSLRVSVSLNGHYTTVAGPGKKDGAPTGMC